MPHQLISSLLSFLIAFRLSLIPVFFRPASRSVLASRPPTAFFRVGLPPSTPLLLCHSSEGRERETQSGVKGKSTTLWRYHGNCLSAPSQYSSTDMRAPSLSLPLILPPLAWLGLKRGSDENEEEEAKKKQGKKRPRLLGNSSVS